VAAAANGVGLCFTHGSSLPRPEKDPGCSGKQNAFPRLNPRCSGPTGSGELAQPGRRWKQGSSADNRPRAADHSLGIAKQRPRRKKAKPDSGASALLSPESPMHAMKPLRFKAVMKIRDGNPYLLVSRARATALKPGWRQTTPGADPCQWQPKAAWRIKP